MKPKRKPLSEKTKETLRKKADKSRFTYGQLAQVYRRGQGAYLSSGSRNVPMAAWAMGRVNSFISGRGGARKADADILKEIQEKMIEITDEMLDIIEKVKGKRNPALWDPRCEQYQRKLKEGTVKKSTTS